MYSLLNKCSIINILFSAGIYLRYVDRQILFQELPSECDVEGGNVLMRNEPDFDNLGTTNIPTGKEFWVGDLLYTPWILPIGINNFV